MRIATALAVILLLAGCTSTEGTDSYLSLAETKSPVQLLRNEAASRVPQAAEASVRETDDFSVSCRSSDDDPQGLIRQWQSTAVLAVPNHVAIDVARALTATFTDEGWTSRSLTDDATNYRTVLTKPASTASIHIEATTSTLDIWTNGPCVTTGGAESDEVTSLE